MTNKVLSPNTDAIGVKSAHVSTDKTVYWIGTITVHLLYHLERLYTKRVFWLYSAKQRNRRLKVLLRFPKQRISLSRTLSDCNGNRSPACPTSIGKSRCLRMGTSTTLQLQMGGRSDLI